MVAPRLDQDEPVEEAEWVREPPIMVLDGSPGEEERIQEALSHVHLVREVWEFIIDDESCAPKKAIHYQYMDATGMPIGGQSGGTPKTTRFILTPSNETDVRTIMQLDTDLQINDALLFRSFSRDDVELIEAVCDTDFQAIGRMIDKIGGWEGLPDDEDYVGEDTPDPSR